MGSVTPDEIGNSRTGPDLAGDTIADPRWFPLRFDVDSEQYQFAFIPAEVHRELAFLRDAKPSEIRTLSRAAVSSTDMDSAPLHLILHSGLGGSTFVARALAQPSVAVPLQEPPILTDVIAYKRKTSMAQMNRLLAEVTQLLARPFAPGEAVICKLSGIGNGLAQAIASDRPTSKLLCLQNPLEQLLSSFAARGISGRMAGRQLLLGIRNSGMMAFEMTDKQLLDHTDFQLAALAWLSIQKMMFAAAQSVGPDRAASITSDQLMRDSAVAVGAVSAHFGLDLDVDGCVAKGIFNRHVKTAKPFDPQRRAELLAESREVHSREIDPVVSWARRVAETTGIPWDLLYPLFDQAF